MGRSMLLRLFFMEIIPACEVFGAIPASLRHFVAKIMVI